MKRFIDCTTSQQGSLTIALAAIVIVSTVALLHAFGGVGPSTALVAPIYLPS